MLIPAYYVIKPTEAFQKKISNLGIDSALVNIFSETVFWNYHKAGDTEDDIFEVKLLFLMNIMSEYLSDKLYKKVFNESSIKLETFDKWWTIERYFIDDNFSEIEERINPSVANFVVKTGRGRVDLWIDKMQNKD